MSIQLRQTQRLSQSLVMTPQLQQAIKLLQLSRLELIDAIQQEVTENPILEEQLEQNDEATRDIGTLPEYEVPLEAPKVEQDQNTTTGDEQKAIDAVDWENYFESTRFALPPSSGDRHEDLPSAESLLVKKPDLADHLLWQLSVSDFSQDERHIAARLIGDIDERGYLSDEVITQVVDELKIPYDDVDAVVRKLQEFDPSGICARHLRECLVIQAIHLGHNQDIVYQIIDRFLPQVEKRHLPVIARELNIGLEQIVEAVKIIEQMDPKPGRQYDSEDPRYIIPDIYVYKNGDDFAIVLNEDGLPKLKVSHYYKEAMQHMNGVAKNYVQEKLRSAVWLIRSIHQRQRTIYKVMESILKFQRDFFERGVTHLKPLVLRQVAEDIGMHESTVSRVTSNKYAHTPQGIFELKYFFSSAVSSVDGTTDIAAEAVKDHIKSFIEHEDNKKPLSDQCLVGLIHERHQVDVARRTVAKYREMMGILPSAKRRRLY